MNTAPWKTKNRGNLKSIPLKRKLVAEIQVRTIFEEGWSEIDHKVRYPNFSENELIGYFLEIFNRMAGSADDMGGFVLGLVETIGHLEREISVTKKEKSAIFQDMERALSQLENVKKQDKASQESISKLKMEVAKLKNDSQANFGLSLFSSSPPNLGVGTLDLRAVRNIGLLDVPNAAKSIPNFLIKPTDH